MTVGQLLLEMEKLNRPKRRHRVKGSKRRQYGLNYQLTQAGHWSERIWNGYQAQLDGRGREICW